MVVRVRPRYSAASATVILLRFLSSNLVTSRSAKSSVLRTLEDTRPDLPTRTS
jgi:hypothetical protein